MTRSKFVGLSSGLFVLILSNTLGAQGISLATSVGIDAYYDDQFDTQIEGSETGATVYRPNMDFIYDGQRHQSTFRVGADYNEYWDSNFSGSSNFNVGWDHEYVGVSTVSGLRSGYSERILDGFEQFDDAVILSNNDPLEVVSVNPYISITLSPTSRLEMEYNYEQNSAQEPGGTTLVSASQSLSANWFKSVSRNYSFGLYLYAEVYQPESIAEADVRLDSNVYGISVGGNYILSPHWTVEGSVGMSQIIVNGEDENQLASAVGDGDNVVIAQVGSTYRGQVDTVTFTLDAGSTQQLDGFVDDQQSVSVAWERRLSEVMSASFEGEFLNAERDDRESFSGELALSWRQSEKLDYQLAYRYRKDESVIDDILRERIGGDSNRITFSVQYSFEQMKFGI